MAIKISKQLRLYETSTLHKKEAFSGSVSDTFGVITGSRMVFTLQVLARDPGATAQLIIRNGFSVDLPLIQVLDFSCNVVGSETRILTDFHNVFEAELIVSGGNADVAVGVSIADNANSTRIENAIIETDVSAYPGTDGKYDSIRLSDGTNEAKVNPNGSLNVNIVSGEGSAEVTKEYFNQAPAVVSGSETNVIIYTVPPAIKALLQRIDVGGANIAEFRYYKNNVLTRMKRTYWGAGLCESFDFFTGAEEGIPLVAGDVVKITALHEQPQPGDFEATVQVQEIDV